MARTGIVARIVVSGSVVYRRAPTLHPLSLHPTFSPSSSYPFPKPRNLETPRSKSCKLLPARQSRGYRATVRTKAPRNISRLGKEEEGKREKERELPFSMKTRDSRLASCKTHRLAAAISAATNRRMSIACVLHCHCFLHTPRFV